jgi:hypothetical protein
MRSIHAMSRPIALLVLLLLAGCSGDAPLLRAGGQYSGVPDSTVGDWRQPQGTLSTGGVIRLNRELPPRL